MKNCEVLQKYQEDRLKELNKYIPHRYSKIVMGMAKKKGVKTSRQAIIDVRTGRKINTDILTLIIEMALENKKNIDAYIDELSDN